MWQALISPIASLLGQALKNKAEEKKAVHDAKMQVIQNTASWEQLMASASATSWKDEWFTLLLSAPVVALMWGIGMNDVEIIDRIGLAFSELNRLPDWYQYLLFMAVSASFGIRGADKLLALKGKKQMALELDIFQDTTANTMFADSTMAAEQEEQSTRTGSFQGTTYQDVLDWYEATGFGDRNPSDPSTYPNVVGSSYIVGEDGGYYNEAGEKLYWFDPPSELGRGGQSSLGDADNKGFYTEAQIRSYWDADQGMGYFKKANPDLTYEAYMGYLSERQTLVESGDIAKLDGDELYRQGHKGRGPNADAINAIVLEERQRVNEQNAQLTSDLASKYGIQQVYQNSDGDVFRFNGSNYHKAFKVDDHDWSKVIGNIVVDYAIGAVTGQLANAFLGLVSPGTTIDSLIKGAASEFGMSIPQFIDTAGVLGGVGTASGGYNEWNDIINSPEWSNVIVNLTGGPDSTPNQPFQGDGEGVDSDGNVVWNTRNLPSIYSIVNGDIVHTESGTVMSEGNYSVDRTQYVSFPPYKPETEAGGGGASSADTSSDTSSTDTSTSTSSTTDAPSNTSGSSGGSPTGSNPNNWPVLTGPSGDVPINNNPDIWNDEDGYGGWVVVSGTGVWGQSGVWVIKNSATGQTQEIDWDNGTYSNPWENNPNNNDADTSGDNQGEGQGDDTESTADGTATGPTTETTPTQEPTVDYPDNGSACRLPNGDVGVKKDGECIVTNNPARDIIGWPNITLPTTDGTTDTTTDGTTDATTDATTDTTDTPSDTTPTDSVDQLCSEGRPEEYGFGQIYYDKYCDDPNTTGDGNDGSGESGENGDGKGDDGTGEGEGGDGTGSGDGSGKEGMLSRSPYKGSIKLLSYDAPPVPPLLEIFQGDWTQGLLNLEDRLSPPPQKTNLFDGIV